MDLLIVARENRQAPPTKSEILDPVDARAALQPLPHGPQIAQWFSRLAVGTLVLSEKLDRGAARAAIGVAMQRSRPKAVVLLGHELGRELLGEGLPLVGGIRELHSHPIAALGQAKPPDLEKILADVCHRAGIPWAPPSSRAAPASTVVRAEEAETQATVLIERQEWARAIEVLRAGEPLGARGTNMLGRALLALGDREGARHAFERTLKSDSTNAIARRQLDTLGPA